MYLENLIILWEDIFSKDVTEGNENIQIVIPHQTCSGSSTPVSHCQQQISGKDFEEQDNKTLFFCLWQFMS